MDGAALEYDSVAESYRIVGSGIYSFPRGFVEADNGTWFRLQEQPKWRILSIYDSNEIPMSFTDRHEIFGYDKNTKIHSFKRLSDDLVFTAGEYITWVGLKGSVKVNYFYQDEFGLKAVYAGGGSVHVGKMLKAPSPREVKVEYYECPGRLGVIQIKNILRLSFSNPISENEFSQIRSAILRVLNGPDESETQRIQSWHDVYSFVSNLPGWDEFKIEYPYSAIEKVLKFLSNKLKNPYQQ